MSLKLFSWNVNGLRALRDKGFLAWLAQEQPDILGLQEVKALPEQLDDALRQPPGYHTVFAPAQKKGYSGVALYSRIAPKQVQLGLGIDEFDSEGRTIVAEYDDFTFITAYFPNGQDDHARVPYKMRYKAAFLDFCQQHRRDTGKPLIFCGDVNTAHHEIDLARPKENRETTGFLPIERAWMDELVGAGYIDTYRHLHPEQAGIYTWWSFRSGARQRNVGWRIDYFFASPDLAPRIAAAATHPDTLGSDHCPISLTLA